MNSFFMDFNLGIDKSQFQMVFNGKYLVNGTIQSNGIQKGTSLLIDRNLNGKPSNSVEVK